MPMRLRNSFLVFSFFSKQPRTQLVRVLLPVFSTPLMTMHRWLDSMTTATPWGFNTSIMAFATSFVSRSWIWRRRAYISAIRGSFEMPMTDWLGM